MTAMSVKQKITRKAAKKTAKHTANGTIAKLRREPLRAVTLLAIGALAGALIGVIAGRSTAGGGDEG